MAANVAAIFVFIVSTFLQPQVSVGPAILALALVPYALGVLVLFVFWNRLLLWSSSVASASGLLVCALLSYVLLATEPAEAVLPLSLVLLLGCVPLAFNVYLGIGGLRRGAA